MPVRLGPKHVSINTDLSYDSRLATPSAAELPVVEKTVIAERDADWLPVCLIALGIGAVWFVACRYSARSGVSMSNIIMAGSCLSSPLSVLVAVGGSAGAISDFGRCQSGSDRISDFSSSDNSFAAAANAIASV